MTFNKMIFDIMTFRITTLTISIEQCFLTFKITKFRKPVLSIAHRYDEYCYADLYRRLSAVNMSPGKK